MKKLFILSAIVLSMAACDKNEKAITKDAEDPEKPLPTVAQGESTGPLTGRWEYVENYVSPGSLWHWEKVQNGAILNIKADSSYELTTNKNGTQYPFFSRFSKAHKGVLSNKPVGNDQFRSFGHLLNTETKDTQFVFYRKIVNRNDTLDISLPCIEGCTYRFIKLKD